MELTRKEATNEVHGAAAVMGFCSLATLGLSLVSLNVGHPVIGFSPINLLDAAVAGLLTWRIWKMSLWASIIGLIYVIAGYLVQYEAYFAFPGHTFPTLKIIWAIALIRAIIDLSQLLGAQKRTESRHRRWLSDYESKIRTCPPSPHRMNEDEVSSTCLH